jgi:hypothetical protein
MSVTKNNHYIPCLWSAYWNSNYYNSGGSSLKAREQVVFSLNIPRKKILQPKVENVFFEKRMGLADLNKQEVIEYFKRNGMEYNESELNDDLTWDFENFFTIMDASSEKVLKKVISTGKIETLEEKAELGWFIHTLQLRNYSIFNKSLDTFDLFGRPKFEMLLNIKWTLSDTELMMKIMAPLLMGTWTLYRSKEFKFPICDNPILKYGRTDCLLPISPKLLLRVEFNKPVNVNTAPPCNHKKLPLFFVYSDFIERTIRNAKRDIIFPEQKLLQKIQKRLS